jgi:hypothetical protein
MNNLSKLAASANAAIWVLLGERQNIRLGEMTIEESHQMTCGLSLLRSSAKQGNILESAAQSMPWTTQTVRTRRHCQRCRCHSRTQGGLQVRIKPQVMTDSASIFSAFITALHGGVRGAYESWGTA